MKNTQEKSKRSGLKIVVLFLSLVFLLISISLFLKFIQLYQQSTFDYKHRYTIAFNTSSSQAVIFSFAPDTKTISELTVDNNPNMKTIGKTLHIPIDAILISRAPKKFQSNTISSQLQELLFHYPTFEGNATVIDFIKMDLFSKSVPLRSITTDTIVLPQDATTIDKLVSSLFADESFLQEQSTVEIVNASSKAGLGNRLATVLTNSGINVVAVSTAESSAQNSSITYFIPQNYTVGKLGKILHYSLKDESTQSEPNQTGTSIPSKKRISDIIITIGEKDSNSNQF